MQMKKILKISLVLVIVLALFTPFVMAVEDEDDDEVEINIEEELGEVEEVDTEAPKEEESEELENETNIEAGASEDEFVFGDFSKATIKITTETNHFKNYYLTIENATFVKNNSYFLLVTHQKEDTSYIKDISKSGDLEAKGYKMISDTYPKQDITEFLEENGDVYYTIAERSTNGKGEASYRVAKTGTLDRLPLNPVGERVKCYFFSDYTSTFFYEFSDNNKNRKIKLKIGPITDNNILIAIRDGKANALTNLLTYAKNSSQTIYTGTVPLGKSDSITTNMNLTNKGYYYVYMQMEDENGKYYPVEDVSLYQGLVSETVGKNLFDYLDSNFKWEISNGNGNNVIDPTIAPGVYPRTGAIVLGVMAVSLIGTSILLFIKNMKYRDVK